MHSLVVTSLQPPEGPQTRHGTYGRIKLFMNALHQCGSDIGIVYFVTDQDVDPRRDLWDAEASQRAIEQDYWGFPVTPHFIRRRSRVQTFYNEYAAGIASAAEQPSLFRWAGPAQAAAIGALLDSSPDRVVVNNLHAMLAVLRSRRVVRNLFFDLDDVQHRVRWRWARGKPVTPGKVLNLAQIPALIRAERAAARAAAGTFVCSEHDCAHLARLGYPRLSVIPNAVAFEPHLKPLANEPVLLFVGSMGHPPNEEAARRMIKKIFPRVRAIMPGARLIVAGPGADAATLNEDGIPHVECLGFVDDLKALYARSRAFVCPMANGGGTRIKLIDAAANGVAMVSTRIGAEGLDLVDGQSVLLAESDEDFAKRCVDLLGQSPLCERLRTTAYAVMRARYDAQSVQDRLAGMFAP